MASGTPSELLEWLADNQFLPVPQVEEMRVLLPGMADRHVLVRELVRRSWLTPFQANQVLQDKVQRLVLGPYRFLERLGEGAMGQVFKAWNVRLGRFVAIKMIHKDHLGVGKVMDRFRQEMETAAQLEHPNIVRVRDADEIDNHPFMVMDFFEGTNLSRLVKTNGPLSFDQACDFVRQTALGLQHAFERGVVHRDIKPSNLLLTATGPNQSPLVKILDFGLGRYQTQASAARLTQVDKIIGTIDYVSPEQVENPQKADHRSDIYSLGCTLFYLLTARAPFPGTNTQEKLIGRLLGEIPSLSKVRSETPAALEAILQSMLARRPEERFQTAAEVAEALATWQHQVDPGMTPGSLESPAAPTHPPLARPVAAALAGAAVPAQPPTEPFSFRSPIIPIAQPVPMPAASEPATELNQDDPFAFAAQSTPEEFSTVSMVDAPAMTSMPSSAAPARKKTGGTPYGIILAGVAVLVVLAVGAWFLKDAFRGKEGAKSPAYPGGSLQLEVPSSLAMKEGETKRIIVKVKRNGFNGPVKVQINNLPSGVSAGESDGKTDPGYFLTLAADRDRAELAFTASYTIGAIRANLKLVAMAEELRAEQTVLLTVARLKK